MKRWALLLFPLLVACAEALPEHIELTPEAETVAFATEPPSPRSYKLLGQVVGLAASKDADVAEVAARNDLRNKAAALGASLVTIDEDLGEPIPLADKLRVRLVGRAYKSVD
jgi:Domain of unknown function (DUF4156)